MTFRGKGPEYFIAGKTLLSHVWFEIDSFLTNRTLACLNIFSGVFQVLSIIDYCLYIFFTELSQKLSELHVIWQFFGGFWLTGGSLMATYVF